MRKALQVFEIAEDQFGYLTASQAESRGIRSQELSYLVQHGDLERRARGVYRMTRFPRFQFGPYLEATLWPYPIQGVISHESALEVYGVSDVSPVAIHVTVPRGYRIRHRQVPPQYVIHRADFQASEVIRVEGVPVTTLDRAIRDCADVHVRTRLLVQAVDDGIAKGLLSKETARQLRRLLTARVTVNKSA